MRSLTIALLSGVVALLFATAVSGSRRTEPVFSSGDLRVIVATKPTQPRHLTFEVGDPYVGKGSTFTTKDYLGYTHDSAFVAKLKQAGFALGGHRRWGATGPSDNLYAAVVFGFLFKETRGAHTWYGTLRSKIGLSRTKGLPHAELGSESLGRHGKGNEEAAIYLWRRGNLDLLAVMNCEGPCEFDVANATRAYADALDATARRVA